MTDEHKQVRAWRAEGMTYPQIQALCIEHGIQTQVGTTPTTKTLHMWTRGVNKPQPRREELRARPPVRPRPSPRTRLDQRPENRGLARDIFRFKEDGHSVRSITELIYDLGYRTGKGTKIQQTQIYRIIAVYSRHLYDRP